MGGPFRYAGVENGDACYCGNADDKFIPTDPAECNIPCTGDPGQFCGSAWRLQVYDTEYTPAPTEPSNVLVLSESKFMVVSFEGLFYLTVIFMAG